MKKQLTTVMMATCLLAGSAAFAQGPAPAASDDIVAGQNIHFLSDSGELQRGVRCAAPELTADQKALVRADVQEWLQSYQGADKADQVISVAFHSVYKKRRGVVSGDVSMSQAQDQIDVLNAAFAGTGFQFSLDHFTSTQNNKWFSKCYNSGPESQMKNALAIDVAHTLNIYSCEPSGGILGYAYLPSTFSESNKLHGVVLLHSSLPGGSAAPYNLGDTGTHEVGHYLGLDHTFANGCSSPGDGVADTPYEASPAFGCPVGRDTCASAGLDPIYNFMDYTDDACMDEFTSDQAALMQAQVALYKPSL